MHGRSGSSSVLLQQVLSSPRLLTPALDGAAASDTLNVARKGGLDKFRFVGIFTDSRFIAVMSAAEREFHSSERGY